MIYNKQPENFLPDIEVVGCLIECDNKILLLHRHDYKPQGGKWGIPAGKMDATDTDKKIAMLRELKEETGLSLDVEDLIFHKTFFVSYPEKNFIYHYHSANLKEIPEIILSESEHKDFSWVTVDEALEMPLIMDEDYCLKDYYGR